MYVKKRNWHTKAITWQKQGPGEGDTLNTGTVAVMMVMTPSGSDHSLGNTGLVHGVDKGDILQRMAPQNCRRERAGRAGHGAKEALTGPPPGRPPGRSRSSAGPVSPRLPLPHRAARCFSRPPLGSHAPEEAVGLRGWSEG